PTDHDHYWSPFLCNHTATPDTYTLSLHDALPIFLVHTWTTGPERSGHASGSERFGGDRPEQGGRSCVPHLLQDRGGLGAHGGGADRKSTRLNSSHVKISYAVFCLKKKNTQECNIE